MTWVKLDDGFPTHPKVIGLSDAAFRAHVTGICYAAQHLTDGWVPMTIAKQRAIAELIGVGLWAESIAGVDHLDGYWIHDYLDYNPSRTDVLAERSKKQAAGRAGGQAAAKARASRLPGEVSNPRPDPSRPEPDPSKTDLRSVPTNPFQPTHDQLYLAEKLDESITPGVVVNLNKRFGISEVSDVLRSMHGFGANPDDWVAYLTGILNARAEAM